MMEHWRTRILYHRLWPRLEMVVVSMLARAEVLAGVEVLAGAEVLATKVVLEQPFRRMGLRLSRALMADEEVEMNQEILMRLAY